LHLGFAAQPFFKASIPGRRNLDGKGCSLVKAEQSGCGRTTMNCNFALPVTMPSV
jgi:hypothetical protein